MVTRHSRMRQPTLTQMEFVQPAGRKKPPLPPGWQRNTSEATGDTFYVHVTSGRIVWKYDDMKKSPYIPQITPKRKQRVIEPAPDNAVSGAVIDMYTTPCRPYRFGTSRNPVQLDVDEDDEVSDNSDPVSETFSELTNSQLVNKKGPRKRLRLLKRVIHQEDETQHAVVLSESGFGSEQEEGSDTSQSPPAAFSQNYLRDEE
jgi:hypothetical protein